MHSNFFSSLKRVEKRLKLDHKSPISHSISALPPQPQAHPQPLENTSNSMESLSSPIILYNASDSHHQNKSSNLEDSEIPLEFLSNSLDFPSTREESSPEKPLLNPPKTLEQEEEEEEEEDVDDIESLIELLNLSNVDENESNLELDTCCSCHCDDGFFGKIVGVKGPKCRKEMERLNGWINYFRKEKMEPLRLAHLLIGKAAFVHSRSNSNGCVELQFPSTIEEFLRHDPPVV